MFTNNIQYHKTPKLSAWRKISLSSWKPTGDSSCYCIEDIEVKAILAATKELDINLHTILIKAVALTIKENPKINATIRFGRIFEREDIAIFVHNVPKTLPDDLDGMLFCEPQTKTLVAINNEYKQKFIASHRGNSEYVSSKKIVNNLPAFVTKHIMHLSSFFAYTLNWHLGIFKTPQNAFGSIMLTSVGSLGITQALCPIAPYTRVPMVISIGKVRDIAIVENDNIVIKKIITFGFTFDHRIMDGIHFAAFLETFKQLLATPKNI
jgi:2-oxoacid dehydrogenases acyltransferase (catalytic domain)